MKKFTGRRVSVVMALFLHVSWAYFYGDKLQKKVFNCTWVVSHFFLCGLFSLNFFGKVIAYHGMNKQ